MNKKMIGFIVGRILLLEGGLMTLPLIISFIYGEPLIYKQAYISIILLLFVIGGFLSFKMPKNMIIYGREGFVIVALSWILMSFFGALPFTITKDIPSFVDAYFEIVSGFTTTGSSIINDLSVISRSNLFWRSFTHLVGGMGVLVLALAIFPKNSPSTVHVMKAEVPGPVFGKLVSKLSTTARVLYKIYLFMTLIMIVLLMLGGLDWFEATLLAMGTAGTGGFAVRNGSILPYDSVYIEFVLGIGMLLFGINFNIYYFILIGKAKEALKNEELKHYLIIVLIAILAITFNLYITDYGTIVKSLRDTFFTVISIITTTGFSTADFGKWPLFSQTILILIMFFGGCAGSTAGGLKISRIVIMIKMCFGEIRQMISPNRIITIKFNEKEIDYKTQRSILMYFAVYMILFFIVILIASFSAKDFFTFFSAVVATINNIGPGLGKVGPAYSFSEISNMNKLILTFVMLAGRLELFPILILFAPSTWKLK